MIFNYAARHRWVDHNPAEYVEKLKDEAYLHHRPVDENILTPDEVRRLVAATDEHHRLLVQTAVFTGMRQGELLGLQWGDIDWNSRQIHVRRAWKDGAFTQPKTRNSQRRVDVPDFLLHELKKWRLRCPKGELDMVFPNGAGNPETHANVLLSRPAPRRAAKDSIPRSEAHLRVAASREWRGRSKSLAPARSRVSAYHPEHVLAHAAERALRQHRPAGSARVRREHFVCCGDQQSADVSVERLTRAELLAFRSAARPC